MYGFCLRDLMLMSRSRALSAPRVLLVATSAAFLLAWGEAGWVPLLPGASLYEQHRAIQWIAITLLVPWIVCRVIGRERGDTCALLSARAGVPPSRLLMGRLIAMTVYLGLLVGSVFPLLLLTQQMSAIPITMAIRDALLLYLFATSAAVLSTPMALWVPTRLGAWLVASATVVLFRSLTVQLIERIPVATIAATIIAALLALGWLIQRADRVLWYLEERG